MNDFIQTLGDRIVQFIGHPDYRPMKQNELARALRVEDGHRRDVRLALAALEREGRVVCLRKNRWALPHAQNLIEGELTVHPDGFGFLIRSESDEPDLFIPARAMNGAIHGDRVVASPSAKRPGGRRRSDAPDQLSGRIERIVERRLKSLAGIWKKTRFTSVVLPQDPRLPVSVLVTGVDHRVAETARNGHAVVIELADRSEKNLELTGRIVKDLGPADQPGAEMACLLHNRGLTEEFPTSVKKFVKNIVPCPANLTQGRRDLRKEIIFTIDPEDARDFDDAISLSKSKSGEWLLTVHIADVASYVDRNSVIDREALRRGNSVYLVDRVITMLPRDLTEDICSLNPKVDRLVHSVRMRLSPAGDVLETETFPAVICSVARLTYEQVQDFLLKGVRPDVPQSVTESLMNMHALSDLLRKRREREGSVLFNMPEVRCVLDDQGHTVDIVPRRSFTAYHLIEEFMLAANRAVARKISASAYSTIYRIHEEPDAEGWERIGEDLAALGYDSHPTTRHALNRIAVEADDTPAAHIVNLAMLRNFKRAVYSGHRDEHFGLAFTHYLHFTSPIRRYADLVAHRVLKALESGAPPPYTRKEAEAIALAISITEREAAEAEAESVDMKRMEYFSRRMEAGEVGPYQAIVTSVMAKGLLVELTESLQKGLIPSAFLGGGLGRGRRSGKMPKMGDVLDVDLLRVDTHRKRIDFKPAGGQVKSARPARGNSAKKKPPTARKKNTSKRRTRRKKKE